MDEYLIRKETAIFMRDITKAYLSKDVKTRAKYCKRALLYAKTMCDAYISSVKNFDELTDKVAKLAASSNELREWYNYVDIALGGSKDRIYSVAAAEKRAVDQYKEKLKNLNDKQEEIKKEN